MRRRFGVICLLVIVTMVASQYGNLAAWAQGEQVVGRHACKWIWDCTRGQCRHIPQCENSYDMVPPEPQELPPLSPVDSGAFMVPDVLPSGGNHCPPTRTCDQMGECVWEVKCR